MTHPRMTTLSEGSSGLIVASDFSATGRTVPGFVDLVTLLRPAPTVWETAPPPGTKHVGMTARDYVDGWDDDVVASGRPVTAVLGYCVGSVFAAALADRVAARDGERPLLIVIDPERPFPGLLVRHYREVIVQLRSILDAAEAEEALAAGERAGAECASMVALEAELAGLLTRWGGEAFRRSGLDTIRTEELLDTFRGFLHYLVVAADIDPKSAWSQGVAISSISPQNGLNLLAADERARIVHEEVAFELQHGELLTDPGVVRVVKARLDEACSKHGVPA